MVKQKKDKRSSKAVFGFVALFAAVAVIVGVGYAYFSDVITGDGTATTGTLDITGTVSCTQPGQQTLGSTTSTNNTAMVDCDTLNLNPGDAIVPATSDLANAGSKSAWIRPALTITSADAEMLPYLWVCTGGQTQAALVALSQQAMAADPAGTFADVAPSTCTNVTSADFNTTVFATAVATPSLANVIAGTGANAETEGTATAATVSTAMPVIYLDAAAPNAVQDKDLAFTVSIQALQYRNNTTYPTDGWETVVTTPFSL